MNLLFRVDAGVNLGLGHAMRCLALAQAWQGRGGQATFLMASADPALTSRLSSEGITTVLMAAAPGSTADAQQTAALARSLGASWAVVDGYHFGPAYQQVIKSSGLKLLVIDDNGEADYYSAELVLNQNLHAEEQLYARREPYTRLLLGSGYVLLRRDFLPWKDWRRRFPETARRMLVALGGSDPANFTLQVIQALPRLDISGLEVKVIIGSSNPNAEGLRFAVSHSSFPLGLENNVRDISRLMAWADMGVSGGGTTSLEAAFMALPQCLVVLAENQASLAARMQESGAALSMGWFHSLDQQGIIHSLQSLALDQQKRREMGERGRLLVNGQGAQRVADAMLSYL
jgi:UDP-2,4-diacetamido-2,4,6-trideoxy-beta-L-altropyranose hydrolase